MPREWKNRLSELPFDGAETDAVIEALESGWITTGPRTAAFEEAFRRLSGTSHAVAVSNGTAALFLALKAAGVGPGDEVVCPSLTFAATAAAIVHCGATPVFADIVSLANPTLDPEDVARRITSRTRAILPVHYAGIPCEMDDLGALASSRGLVIVEDAAHAPGASYRGRRVGSLGIAGCFSLYGNKNLTTAEGGIITTSDPALADRLRLLRSHGMTSTSWDREIGSPAAYDVVEIGYNFRFDDVRAAIGLVQIEKLERNNGRRQLLAARYGAQLRTVGADLALPMESIAPDRVSAFHVYPVVCRSRSERDHLESELRRHGIQTSIHYPPVHQLTAFRRHVGAVSLPVTEEYGNRELTLPLHAGISDGEIDAIVDEIGRILSVDRE